MKRLFLLLLLALPLAAVAFAAPADSLARRMALLAARGDADRLRPLYVRSADSLPPYTRLYCQMALARADRRYGRMVACIDTLLDKYPRRLGTNGRFALVELKAGGLRRLGRYDELATFCRRELKSYRRKRFDRERLGRLVAYERLARRLGGATPRARLLSLADRDSVFTLREEYPRLSAAADTFARRRAALSLALAFRRDADALRLADSLLVHHADSLIDEDFAHVAHARARLLVRAGRWAELSALASRCAGEWSARGVDLSRYGRWGEAWRDEPPTLLQGDAGGAALHLTRDWPLLASFTLNAGDAVPFLLDTGQEHTLVSSGLARSVGLRVLPDTLSVATPLGLLRVSPALADSLHLGSLTLSHFFLYVTADTARFPAGVSAIMGCDDLARLGRLTFSGERLSIAPLPPAAAATDGPNLWFSTAGTPLLRASCEGSECVFGIDTGNAGNAMSSIVFPREQTDTLAFAFSLDGRRLSVGPVVLRDYRSADRDGALGAPFLRSFSEVTLDFHHMRLTAGSHRAYEPLHVFDYMESGDLFGLERNARALTAVSSPRDTALMHLHIDGGKNCPALVAAEAARLLATIGGEDDGAEAGERDYLLMYRINALVRAGQYAEAARMVDEAGREGLHSGAVREMLLHLGATCAALSGTQPTRITSGGGAVAVLRETTDESGRRSIGITVNKKEMEAAVDPSLEVTRLTERAARRLKVRIVHRHGADAYAVGVIDSLRLGRYVLRDVLCHVLPDKERRMTLGFNVLSLFSDVTFAPGAVTFVSDAPAASGATVPLRFDGRLCVEGLAPGGYLTLGLVAEGRSTLARRFPSIGVGTLSLPASAFVPGDFTGEPYHLDGTLSVPHLVKAAGSVRFDFQRMQLSYPR